MRIDGRMTEMQGELQKSAPGGSVRQRSVTSIPRSDAPESTGAVPGTAAEKPNAIKQMQPVVDLQKAAKTLSDLIRAQRKDVAFSVDEDAESTVIKFFNTETGELIKQYPPEEILAMIARMRQMSGLLVDERA